MEKEIKIKTDDGKLIHGTLVTSKTKSDKLVVFVHGFTGHPNEHIFFNGAKLFSESGLDSFRFSLYDGGDKDYRQFRDTKISLHGEDINTVVKNFRKKYKKIFVVGHSYGGTSLLFTDSSQIDAFVFWDASYINWKERSDDFIEFNKKFNMHVASWGIEVLVGNQYIEELKNFPDCGELIKKINKPALFVGADKGNAKASEKYYTNANDPKTLEIIKNADHNFNNFKAEETLLELTKNWINKN